jgi:hypothetical protein
MKIRKLSNQCLMLKENVMQLAGSINLQKESGAWLKS